jgi:putative PIN family toxin of toxin-antitoxin system
VLRVVFDPNVLVSAVITPVGPPAEALDAWRNGEFDLIVSPRLLDELEDVLLRPKFRAYVSPEQVGAYVEALAAEALAFDDPADPPRVSLDPGDDYLIALARTAGADLLVSGDKHLTDLADPPVRVMTPRDLLARLP